MPKYKRKRYKRKRRTRKRGYAINKSPMPVKYVTKLRYAELGLSTNPGAGLVGQYIFRANDLYDPNYSGTGHQPRGFDQLMPLYNHFTVLGSKATLRISNDVSDLSLTAFLTLQGEPTTQLNPIDYMERMDVSTRQLAGKKTGGQNTTLSRAFSTKKFFSKTNVLDDTTLRGSVSGSPSEVAYYHFGVVSSDGSSDPLAITFSINIDYIVAFHEPNDVASS